jgi:hypothetical protein
LPIEQLQSAGFCLLGLWLLTEAIPRATYWMVMVYYSTRPNTPVDLGPGSYAQMFQIAVEIALALWMLFGARGLLGLVRWARTAGTGEPSNTVVESDAQQESPRAPHHER